VSVRTENRGSNRPHVASPPSEESFVTYIDGHTHAFAPDQRRRRAQLVDHDPTFAEMYRNPLARMATVDEIVATMDRALIDGSVVVGFPFREQRDIDDLNEHLLEARSRNAGKVGVVAAINPALPGWGICAQRALDGGARGFGELRPHNQGWDPLGKEARAFYGLARDAGAVLLWHCSERVGHDYPGKQGGIFAEELVAVAQACPGLRMVAAHLGAGLPFFLQMPEIREALSDVSFDTAAVSLLYDDESVARLVSLAGPQRVLFASDYPLLSPRRQLERVLAVLPDDAVELVCGGNARELYLEPSEP
jgi:predicted TIM-barrel fold metal-dependent hydrolase